MTRDVRVDKGGVVDLVQVKGKKPTKNYQIQKVTNHRSPSGKPKVIRYNPKDRERSAKIVQGWWREILTNFKNINKKVTKIQAHYRGSLVRSYIFELLYFSLLAKNFSDKFQEPLIKHSRKAVIQKLIEVYGEEVRGKFTVLKIIKIQKVVKNFLKNMKDRKMKFCLLCEKIKYRYINSAFKKINNPMINKKFQRALNVKFLFKISF